MCYVRFMVEKTVIQGRETTTEDIELIRHLIRVNPSWSRTRISKELCELWDWYDANGQMKDMAARSFLRKCQMRGLVELPPPSAQSPPGRRVPIRAVPYSREPITAGLRDLMPVRVEPVVEADRLDLFKCLLSRHHYLGMSTVGKNIAYMAFDSCDRPLACLLFGSAAWKCACRDEFIGWDAETREAKVNLITNNSRFLVLPWVRIPHLASHVLSQVARRIAEDWREKYGHGVHLLETFVERDRFMGTCYRAANWIHLGHTTGRSRNDTHFNISVPVKDVYVYPLSGKFREALCG